MTVRTLKENMRTTQEHHVVPSAKLHQEESGVKKCSGKTACELESSESLLLSIATSRLASKKAKAQAEMSRTARETKSGPSRLEAASSLRATVFSNLRKPLLTQRPAPAITEEQESMRFTGNHILGRSVRYHSANLAELPC